ncbi:hypothetical protein Tco_1430493 [Tanacetum coccineum]
MVPQPRSPTHTHVADEVASTGVDVRYGGATTTVTGLEAGRAVSTKNTRVSTADDITMVETMVYIRKSAVKDKDKDEQSKNTCRLSTKKDGIFAAQELKKEGTSTPIPAQTNKEPKCQLYQERKRIIHCQQLRGYSFDEIKISFKTIMRKVNTFVLIESEVDRAVPELAAESSKRAAEEELDQESSKRQKTGESSELAEEPRDKEADELFTLKALRSTRRYHKLEIHLRSLVKEKFNSTEPTDDKEREIWVELKRLFEQDTDDELWKLQKKIHDLTWWLYDLCGVHHVYTEEGIDIYMLVEKEYPLSRGTLTLMLVTKLLVDQDNKMSRELLRKIFMQVERPRR